MRVLLFAFLFYPFMLTAQSALRGKLFDSETKEPILFGTVALIENEKIIKGVETDLDGNFYFSDITPGVYALTASYVGYTPSTTKNVRVLSNQTTRIELTVTEGILFDGPGCVSYDYPLFEFDNTSSGAIFVARDIKNMPIPK